MVHSNVEYTVLVIGICFILGQSNLANPDLQETDRRCRGMGDVRLFVSFPFTPDASFILPPLPAQMTKFEIGSSRTLGTSRRRREAQQIFPSRHTAKKSEIGGGEGMRADEIGAKKK